MTDLLDRYPEDRDPRRPVVCCDATSKQLPRMGHCPSRPAPDGWSGLMMSAKDKGTRNLFMFCEPKGGWRRVAVTGRRTALAFARQMKWVVDQADPDAPVIRLALDNLNTPELGSRYASFAPAAARRIAQRLEFHYTPKHGSWLNMAELELSVVSRQRLARRIGAEGVLRREVSALA